MKSKIILTTILFALFSFFKSNAQTNQYQKEWKRIDSLMKKNLPKSALAEVKKIYDLAKKNNQDAQIIKSLIYITNLQHENREENEVASIKEIEKEIPQHKEPATSILKNYLATLYQQYLNRNRWKLYQRTNTTNFIKEDIATWNVEDLHKKISELYLQSIQNQKILQGTKLEPFEAIIIKGNARYLRPTLYDLLANRALDYFKNDERNIKKPSYAFEINDPAAFAPAAEFAAAKFTTRDSLSLHFKALQVYQELIRFHLNDAKKEALIDIDVDRIEFVKNHSVLPDKEERYKAALENIIASYRDNTEIKQAQYLLAAYYESLASQYDPLKDTTHRYTRLKAKEILESVVKDSATKNEAWSYSFNLLKEINRKTFLLETEKVNVPDKPFRSLVRFKNVNGLYLRLIKADEALKKQLENRRDDNTYWNALINARPIKNWQQSLPQTNDLQTHSVEIKVDALPVGEYFILASSDDNFNKTSVLGAQFFYVSNISYVNQSNKFFILHRETGQPLQNAAVEVFTEQYDYKTYRHNKVKKGSYKTNNNGFFTINDPKDERQRNAYFLNISHGNDHLNMNEQVYDYYNYDITGNNTDEETKKIFFFTDRSIYRPGQTVYFKGIVLKKEGSSNEIITGYKTKIFLEDANGEDKDSVEVTTNEFGSFSGKFQLPKNILNGNFSIYDGEDENRTSFSVEEYKRPKFYVSFNKIKGSYKVNDSITLSGNAVAYAGNNINSAKVSYRVVRQPRFIYPWLTWRWLPATQPMEIAHGEVVTNDDGSFNIIFKAIPDLKIEKKTDPVFDYRIYVDVTDINGETRSGEQVVSAGYKSLILKVALTEKISIDSLKSLSIRTENMNGEFEPAKVNVRIFSLKEEERLMRIRYWQQPDQFVMSKEEFISNFPNDVYKDENDFKTWERELKVHDVTDSSRVNGNFNIQTQNLKPGFYAIEIITHDKEGAEVKDIRYIELFDETKKDLNRPEYLWVKANDKVIEPGERTSIQIGSAAKDVFLIEQVDKIKTEGSNTDFDFKKLGNERKSFEFGATEKDRGGYGVSYFFVKDNRFYQVADVIHVPWTNKELKIEYGTFRDKTLPGSEEKWTVKISGYKGDKVAAEMLASMYDASLDQFKMHQWNKPGIWPTYARTLNWTGQQNFAAIQMQQRWLNEYYQQFINKQYDRLAFTIYEVHQQESSVRLRGMTDANVVRDMAVTNAAPVVLQGKAAGLQVEENAMSEVVVTGYGNKKAAEVNKSEQPTIQPRKNFNETAFFFPHLKTDKDGSVEFSFTMPEALTKWKIQALTHTKDLAFGLSQNEIVTQKQLMVQPNAPRFLREGDRIEFSTKIANLTDKEFTGQAQLLLFDAVTNESVDGWFQNIFPNQYFTVAGGKSEVVKFPIQVPYQFNKALVWRIVAKAENFTDGEESSMPVLTNKTLVTETITLPMKNSGTKSFTLDGLKNLNSETAQHHALTVEYTSNPTWYVVQALPYLMEFPYECAEQTWNRYYANSLATRIVNASPRIKQIFQKWSTRDTAALLSNLQKNEELKSVLLEETPWVLQAKTEEQQKKNIALLFDAVRMSNELAVNIQKLKDMQSENGGFVWFKGGPDDRYITQYITTGIGHLKKLGGYINGQEDEIRSILKTAIPYLDKKIKEDYDYLVKHKVDLSKDQIGAMQIQYLYMRSFFPEVAIPTQTAYAFYRKQAEQFWTKKDKYMQGMIALALNRGGNKKAPADILKSLKETAIIHEELGMYWKDNTFGKSWYWWHAPIETQSLLIEAFTEIGNDKSTVNELRTWLLKNKQTTNWRTTKATAEACYAMLLQGTDWLSNEPVVNITLGNTVISNDDRKSDEGTGYFKQTIEGPFVNPEMGTITVSVQNKNPQQSSASWGAVYWQYFEELDKISNASTPLQLTKKLFVEKNGDRGPVLTPISNEATLQVGDKIKVRIELKVDRDMEYVHMKDMRASALEPVNVLSGYKWQGGLGYYETTKDASTNFFFNYLRKGTYVFEYPLFVTHTGNFSNGITTIQSMYAPEFTAHSEGVRITVEQ